MSNYTDEEVLTFVEQQEKNFINTSKGFGFEAKNAKFELAKIQGYTQEERINIGRKALLKFNLKSA